MSNKDILLIDDEDYFRNSVKIALRKKGYQVTDAADGYKGMQEIIRSRTAGKDYHLIVLDIMMPKISGTDILEYVVNKEIKTPVLVITGFMNYDIKCFCSRLNRVEILQKPFNSKEFLEKITEMITEDNIEGENEAVE